LGKFCSRPAGRNARGKRSYCETKTRYVHSSTFRSQRFGRSVVFELRASILRSPAPLSRSDSLNRHIDGSNQVYSSYEPYVYGLPRLAVLEPQLRFLSRSRQSRVSPDKRPAATRVACWLARWHHLCSLPVPYTLAASFCRHNGTRNGHPHREARFFDHCGPHAASATSALNRPAAHRPARSTGKALKAARW
jgi:hypothetical protein